MHQYVIFFLKMIDPKVLVTEKEIFEEDMIVNLNIEINIITIAFKYTCKI